MSQLGPGAPATSAGALTWPALRTYFEGHRVGNYVRPLPEHDLVYVKNPKAGCSTILLWLDRLHTGEFDVELGNIHLHNRLPKLREVGRRRTIRMLSGSAYRFSFVRNPLRRFESVYWDKIARPNKVRARALASLGLPTDPETSVSFEEFLTAVEQQDPVTMNPHWRPQHINLVHPLVTYDHIGKLESFEADRLRICEEAGLPPVPLAVRNVSKRSDSDSVYDGRPDLVGRVEQVYATDFELYGY